MIQPSDGAFYGTTTGGAFGNGTVFRVGTDGTVTTLHTFTAQSDGSIPTRAPLVQGSDGNFYGQAYFFGDGNHGVIFRITPGGDLTPIYSFTGPDGEGPIGGLIRGSEGNFYGVTQRGGTNGAGTIYKITAEGALQTIYNFANGADGGYPDTGLVLLNGSFYGTTNFGTAGSGGTIYRVNAVGAIQTLHTFTDGSTSKGRLIAGPDGNLYGTTFDGGTAGRGSIFRITPGGAFTILHSFDAAAGGQFAEADLALGSDGNFYGTTAEGGANNHGTAFRITPAGALTTLHSFNGASDGSIPTSLRLGTDGNFYGTTYQGGQNGLGTIFRMTQAGAVTTLHHFAGAPLGSNPYKGVIRANDGNFYGTTYLGGTKNHGVIFRMTPAGVVTVLYHFQGKPDGGNPFAKLVQAADGSLYGTTQFGGANDLGTVYKIALGGVYTLLHSFSGADGADPRASLVEGSDGRLYGTTFSGGTGDRGVIYSITAAGVTVLHRFSGTDGANPYAPLLRASDGNFYGTTSAGGAAGLGTVFRITPAGAFTSLHSFTASEGTAPRAALVEGGDGNFYGTTRQGGANGGGTVFRVTPAGAVTILHSFGANEGRLPDGALTRAPDGSFYGTTAGGGLSRKGTIFRVTTSGQFTTVYNFTGGLDGGTPLTDLLLLSNGTLIGVTYEGGRDNAGTIFRLSLTSALNISTRARVDSGENLMIGGFIITGSGEKKVIIRGIGPSLSARGVPAGETLQDPVLELRDEAGDLIRANDDWRSDQAAEITASTIPPSDDREAAIVATLQPGTYTALLRGKNEQAGVGLVEIYDLQSGNAANLAQISTRGRVLTGNNVMIGGFITGGGSESQILIRAIGPSLAQRGITGALQDPTLALHDQNGALIASNDDWKSDQQAIAATGAAPEDDRESAILRNLPVGPYTAIVRGKNDTTGVALVEVFVLP